jgi:hypothetical protein
MMKPLLQALSVSEVSTPVKNLEVFMKLIAVLALAVFVNGAFAESAFEKKNKKIMSERTDTLILKVETARAHLKKEEVKEACAEIQEMLQIYPEHLKSIGQHMNNYKTKVVVARDEVLQQLIFVHRQSVVCGQGENAEHVDPKDMNKKLKKISKSLNKQKKLIEKEKTNYANEFYYNYEF